MAYPIDHLAASYASVVADFVDASNQVTPHRLPALVAEAAAGLGSRTARVWLADHHQRTLRHLPAGTPEESLSIDGTSGGRAFISTKVVDHVDDVGNHHLWLPMLDGVDRLGVLEVESGPLDPGQHVALGRLATFAASALTGRSRYTDAFTLTRRREQMSLAELQWQMLPPGTFAAEDVSVAGMMEPAYDIGGDSFDYSHEPDRLRFAIFDAVGHDLASSAISSLTVGAYRNSRRRGTTLLAMAEEMDQVIRAQIGDGTFATGQLAELDTSAGVRRCAPPGGDPATALGHHRRLPRRHAPRRRHHPAGGLAPDPIVLG